MATVMGWQLSALCLNVPSRPGRNTCTEPLSLVGVAFIMNVECVTLFSVKPRPSRFILKALGHYNSERLSTRQLILHHIGPHLYICDPL